MDSPDGSIVHLCETKGWQASLCPLFSPRPIVWPTASSRNMLPDSISLGRWASGDFTCSNFAAFFFFLRFLQFKGRETQSLERTVSHVLHSYSFPFPHGHQQVSPGTPDHPGPGSKAGSHAHSVCVLLPCL